MPEGGPCRGLTAKEAARWLIHSDEGRQWAQLREGAMSMGQMVANLVNLSADAAAEANKRREASNKREAPIMSSTETILKNARRLGEAGVTQLITDYAKRLYPELTSAQAFTKVFTADDDEAKALRYIHAVSKAALDERIVEPPDDAEDALAALNELAAAERRRDPSLSREKAFSKIYCDPNNSRLAQLERRQNRPRA